MRRAVVLVALAALAGAGCGNERTPAPDVRTPDPPADQRRVTYEDAGVRFNAPANWQDLQPQGSRIGGIQSRTATVAVWRYPRTEPLPETDAPLEEVQELLEERIEARDGSFELESSDITRRAGAPAIELVGRQTIAGLPFGVRSSHVFEHGAEVVVDAFAPPEHFERVDETVFVPLLESLRVSEP